MFASGKPVDLQKKGMQVYIIFKKHERFCCEKRAVKTEHKLYTSKMHLISKKKLYFSQKFVDLKFNFLENHKIYL